MAGDLCRYLAWLALARHKQLGGTPAWAGEGLNGCAVAAQLRRPCAAGNPVVLRSVSTAKRQGGSGAAPGIRYQDACRGREAGGLRAPGAIGGQAGAERRRRLAEPDLEFRAFCTRRRLPASSTRNWS